MMFKIFKNSKYNGTLLKRKMLCLPGDSYWTNIDVHFLFVTSHLQI